MLPDVEVDSIATSKHRSREFERALDRGRWHLNPSILVCHDIQGVVAKLKDNNMYREIQNERLRWDYLGWWHFFIEMQRSQQSLYTYTYWKVEVSGDEIRDVHSVCSFPRSGFDRSVPPMIVTVADEAEGGEGVTVGPSLVVVGHF